MSKSFVIFLLTCFILSQASVFAGNYSTHEQGIQLYREENFEYALELFHQLEKIAPSSVLFYYLGLTYRQTGDLHEDRTLIWLSVNISGSAYGFMAFNVIRYKPADTSDLCVLVLIKSLVENFTQYDIST